MVTDTRPSLTTSLLGVIIELETDIFYFYYNCNYMNNICDNVNIFLNSSRGNVEMEDLIFTTKGPTAGTVLIE
ncbi:hypothetical protein BDP55DRAFT_730031 [Colletotrichum godetiae]|uniref:Uncharacterized protein n=1 Tax=Colletotrichum godetiae TaxID=1209918 RepID=A0AAJ0AHA9_9PEZI|nr:uncharacterized protein BDP55DRAFT_730031 [Colletotrichum godetiae]KAK1673871.1 hypothetical protein BDP55DRAFT_730031 [Colletotrichum godetiae]